MQASTQRLVSTLVIALAGAAILLVGAEAAPAGQPAAVTCGLLAQVTLAPR